MDPDLRLVHVEGRHGPGRSRRRLAGAGRHDGARARGNPRGRQLIIFPEGTRRAPGAEPRYKFGVAQLYAEVGVPCVPVALNSGLFWPRRAFLRLPGTIVVEFLPPIPPGLDKEVFLQRLQSDIETATARLIAEGEAELQEPGPASVDATATRIMLSAAIGKLAPWQRPTELCICSNLKKKIMCRQCQFQERTRLRRVRQVSHRTHQPGDFPCVQNS